MNIPRTTIIRLDEDELDQVLMALTDLQSMLQAQTKSTDLTRHSLRAVKRAQRKVEAAILEL